MSICTGCGASYDDTFKFCPHCGRAKPEPESINLNVRIAPVRYEEAELKIEVVGMAELTEPPFDYRPSGLTKLLGEDGKSKSWTSIAILRLLLESTHPDKGRYLAYASGTFRGFIERDFKLPNALVDRFTALKFTTSYPPHKWLLDLFDERHQRWDEFNWYLISEGWIGLTQHATDRKAPLYDDPNLYINRNDGNLSPFFQVMLMATTSDYSHLRQVRSHGDTGGLYDLGNSYRYRRSLHTNLVDDLLEHPLRIQGFQPLTRDEAHTKSQS